MKSSPSPPQRESPESRADVLLERTFACLTEAVFVVDTPARTIMACNAAAESMFGYQRSEFIGRNTQFLHVNREMYEEFAARLFPTLDKEGVFQAEFQMRRKDGSVFFTDHTVTQILDDSGCRTALVSVVRDITERKRAEEIAQVERDRLETVTQHIGAGLAIISREYRTVWANGVLRQIFGEVEGKPCYLTFNKRREVCPKCGVRRVFEGGVEVATHEQAGKDIQGTAIWSRIIATPIRDSHGNITAALEVVVPITDLKLAEEALQVSGRRFRALIENSSEGIALCDPNGRILYASPSTSRILGYPSEKTMGLNSLTIVHPDDRPLVRDLLSRVAGVPDSTFTADVRLQHSDGSWRWIDAIAHNLLADPDVKAIVINLRDITERKRDEETIVLQSRITANMSQGVTLIRPTDQVIIYANLAYLEMFGYSWEELIGQHVSILNAPGKEGSEDVVEKVVRELESTGFWSGEFENVRKDGSRLWTRAEISPLLHPQYGKVWITVQEDITERKRLEEQLLQAQKMEAISTLAGGLAHDLNNILTSIMGYSDLLLRKLKSDDPLRSYAEGNVRAITRAAHLTQQLLAFSRGYRARTEVLDLNAIVTDFNKMLRRLIREDIEVVMTLYPELDGVEADPAQIEQVLMNLAVNAGDAMAQGGWLTIQTANVEFGEVHARQHLGFRPGSYVMLSVSDTGCGMSAEVQSHIFEPFFTTKETGKGTGLGLSTVYGIVKQSNGHIEVESTPGQGATFRIYFPRADTPVRPRPPVESAHLAELSRGAETVLVVEDEEAVLSFIREILQSAGYTVLPARNGQKALAMVEEYEGPIHLLVTDVVMPKMGGPELVRRLRPVLPKCRVIYISGYAPGELESEDSLRKGVTIISKPFRADLLLRTIRQVLSPDEPGSSRIPAS